MEVRGSKQPFSVERRQGRQLLQSFKPKAGCAGSIPASPLSLRSAYAEHTHRMRRTDAGTNMKPITDERIIELLSLSEQDPMWADHAEISKSLLRETIKLLTRQKAALGNCHKEIFKLRDALTSQPVGEQQ